MICRRGRTSLQWCGPGLASGAKRCSIPLSAGLRWEKDATRALLTAAGIAENARAEQVTLEQWKALTRAYFS